MTRTERNQNPAALAKDRHSRSGLTKSEQDRKGGAGAHNWGSYRQQQQQELSGDLDANVDLSNATFEDAPTGADTRDDVDADVDADADAEGEAGLDGLAPLPKIKDEMTNGHTKDLAKEVIAASPAESMGSMASVESPGVTRRMSGVSDEERREAGVFRKRALSKGDLNLNDIARTSYGVQSPPIATSPIKNKSSYFK